MKLVAGLGVLGMLGGGLYASDALTSGTVYDKPYAQAYQELVDMPLLPGPGAEGGANATTVVERAPGRIAWRLSMGPVEVGRFTATLSQVGADRTRVIIDFVATPVVTSEYPILTSALTTDFARLAMVEQVDARMENRAPDLREIQWAAARHLQANPALMQDFGGALEAQFKQVNKMLQSEKTGQVAWDMPADDAVAEPAPVPDPADAARPTTVFPDY